jgi:hypothetical protein
MTQGRGEDRAVEGSIGEGQGPAAGDLEAELRCLVAGPVQRLPVRVMLPPPGRLVGIMSGKGEIRSGGG